jgi:uncharacterized protein
MRVLLIHGSYGSASGNWFASFKAELEARDVEVHAPQFPTPINQSPRSWLAALERSGYALDEQTIIVAHSLGALFALHLLENSGQRITAAFFVAPFLQELGNRFDEVNRPFFKEFDFELLREQVPASTVYLSDNDPYVPFGLSVEFGMKFASRLVIRKGAGHFNEESGYTQFPRLLQDILETLDADTPETI